MRLGNASPLSVPPLADEPIFRMSEIVEPSSSDMTSREPSADKELPLVVRDVPGSNRRAAGSKDAVPDGGDLR